MISGEERAARRFAKTSRASETVEDYIARVAADPGRLHARFARCHHNPRRVELVCGRCGGQLDWAHFPDPDGVDLPAGPFVRLRWAWNLTEELWDDGPVAGVQMAPGARSHRTPPNQHVRTQELDRISGLGVIRWRYIDRRARCGATIDVRIDRLTERCFEAVETGQTRVVLGGSSRGRNAP